mmetsp:Transcript_57749/g.162896  ORF Transcript_57749/g.162896 Transcript_57749/m.162896 type:complete len:220 (-) Transcript_57749:1209-1868(-)
MWTTSARSRQDSSKDSGPPRPPVELAGMPNLPATSSMTELYETPRGIRQNRTREPHTMRRLRSPRVVAACSSAYMVSTPSVVATSIAVSSAVTSWAMSRLSASEQLTPTQRVVTVSALWCSSTVLSEFSPPCHSARAACGGPSRRDCRSAAASARSMEIRARSSAQSAANVSAHGSSPSGASCWSAMSADCSSWGSSTSASSAARACASASDACSGSPA